MIYRHVLKYDYYVCHFKSFSFLCKTISNVVLQFSQESIRRKVRLSALSLVLSHFKLWELQNILARFSNFILSSALLYDTTIVSPRDASPDIIIVEIGVIRESSTYR